MAIATAMFYPFVLFNQMQPIVVESEIDCETFDSNELSINLLAHTNVPYVDGLVTKKQDNSKLTLLLINRYPFTRVKARIQLEGDSNLDPVTALQIHAQSPEAYNSFSKPHQIRLSDAALPRWKDGVLHANLKPCSVYFVEMNLTK